jgi:hypothetical protein
MKECPNCDRLKQRVAELNSELLVLKIAAIAARPKVGATIPPSRKTRTATQRKQSDQPQVS